MSLFTHPYVTQVIIFLGSRNEKEHIEEILLKREHFDEHKQNNMRRQGTHFLFGAKYSLTSNILT